MTWWHDNVEIGTLSHPSADEGVQAIVNQLFIATVTRDFLGTKLQCRAQGSKMVPAVVKEVTVQVHSEYLLLGNWALSPGWVTIRFTNDRMNRESGRVR